MLRPVMPSDDSVVAACFAGLPEYDALAGLRRDRRLVHHWRLVEDRIELVPVVARMRPLAVLLPSMDASGLSSAPLIERLSRQVPGIPLAVLVRDDSATSGLTDALRAGADILCWGSSVDLSTSLLSFIASHRPLAPEGDAIRAICSDLAPEHCVQLLVHCVEHAHLHLSVDTMAHDLHVSRRSLSRWLRSANWPAPLELIEWGRVLRASLAQWMGSHEATSLARAAGFASPTELRHSSQRLLGSAPSGGNAAAPLHVTAMLRRRLEDLSREARVET